MRSGSANIPPLSPHHPAFTTLLAYAWAFDGDVDQRTDTWTGCGRCSTTSTTSTPSASSSGSWPSRSHQVKRSVAVGHVHPQRRLAAPRPGRTGKEGPRRVPEKGHADGVRLPARVPRYLRTDFKFIVDEMIHAQPALGPAIATLLPAYTPAPSVFRFTDAAGEQAAGKILERHPDGSSRAFFAGRLYHLCLEEKEKNGWSEKARGMLAKAAAELEIAGRTPGLFNPQMSLLEDSYYNFTYAGTAPRRPPQANGLVQEGVRRS